MTSMTSILQGLLIPFVGTSLGAACVLFMKKDIGTFVQKLLSGFAAGVMVAASVWSLLIPAIDQSEDLGRFAFAPAAIGFVLGMLFLLLLDTLTPHMHLERTVEGPRSSLKNTTMMFLAVTIHNIPEGMAVGVLYAAWLAGESNISLAAAFTLSLGIAIQNFPEGAIISMPLHSEGMSKGKSFLFGVLSGLVEPVAGIITVLLAGVVTPILPYFLSFAAGAMIFVVIDELVPEMAEGKHSNWGVIAFMLGFTVMMTLDVALG